MESPTSHADAMWHPDRRESSPCPTIRILALPGEARKCPGRTSGQLKKVGVLLY